MFWLFILAVVTQIGYALYFFIRRLPVAGRPLPAPEKQAVSVIICAKNESNNLTKNLPLVLAQAYTKSFEVVVVNDASTDNTNAVLEELAQQFSHLRIITVVAGEERNLKGKKYALSKGVAAATNSWLLLTDADCAPASNKWLELMTAPLAQNKEIVAGYGGYSEAPGFLNVFIRWETLHTFLQYSSYILAGKPYMAVGRNMACTKGILQMAQQSALWNKLPSGDDDLLVRIAGNKRNTAIVTDKAAFTLSSAETTWREWTVQKQRHLSTGKYYKWDIKLLLGIYAASHAVAWLAFFFLLFSPFWKAAALLMAARCLLYWTIWAATARKLHKKKLAYFFPVSDIAWMIYNFAFLPYIAWQNKQRWK